MAERVPWPRGRRYVPSTRETCSHALAPGANRHTSPLRAQRLPAPSKAMSVAESGRSPTATKVRALPSPPVCARPSGAVEAVASPTAPASITVRKRLMSRPLRGRLPQQRDPLRVATPHPRLRFHPSLEEVQPRSEAPAVEGDHVRAGLVVRVGEDGDLPAQHVVDGEADVGGRVDLEG